MAYKDRYIEFEQYLTSGEQGAEGRAHNWAMATYIPNVNIFQNA